MNFLICCFLFFIGSFIATKLLLPLFFHLFYQAGCTRSNYRGDNIPVGIGFIFIPVLSGSVICIILFHLGNQQFELAFLLGVFGMGIAGLLDDLLGNRNVTGLKGHFMMLLKKRELTTGGFKAIFGGILSLMISILISKGWIDVFLNTLIIALFTNFINLLDLRPGRALKGFLLSGFLLFVNSIHPTFQLFLLSLAGSSLAYMPSDLKARSMMGDVGSNILGISLGMACASCGLYTRVIVLVLLVSLHIYTEKYSLTETIEKNKLLKYLDQLGR